MKVNSHPAVAEKINNYPPVVKKKMKKLRQLILETARETESIQEINESLKWGEPSYAVKKGSPIRMDWKEKTPDQYALYFNCSTSLIETFKAVFGNTFRYEKNRAILFDLSETLPEAEVKRCVKMALQYHFLKDKPFLGQ